MSLFERGTSVAEGARVAMTAATEEERLPMRLTGHFLATAIAASIPAMQACRFSRRSTVARRSTRFAL
jgi:hypothetical protein